MQEISNNKLTKFLSLEVMGSLFATAFMVGVVWSSLAADVEQADHKVDKLTTKNERLETDVSSIQVDMAVVKANQLHLKDDLEKQTEKLRETSEDVKQILRILSTSPHEHSNPR